MSLSASDYQKLYKFQDEVFAELRNELSGFYLTGGTALGRFYLNHRYSDDLDFFVNADPHYQEKVNLIYRKLKTVFKLDESLTLLTEAYTRMYISSPQVLKIDIVNDLPEHWGNCNPAFGIMIDNPANILSNKLGTILSRNEPKDIYDIVSISEAYSFNWKNVYLQTLKKQVTNETDIGMRIAAFPVQWLDNQTWLKTDFEQNGFSEKLRIISNEILFARDNSLGEGKIAIEQATIQHLSV